MLDILWTIFNTLIHAIQVIINIITSIPVYIGYLIDYINYLPAFIIGPIMIGFIAAVIIHIKRLVL